MARSALLGRLRRAYAIAQVSLRTGLPADELLQAVNQSMSRRRFLYGGLALGTALAAVTLDHRTSFRAIAAEPKVLIVGAGIAGLTAAYRLRQAGVPVDIVEASNHLGGRIRSLPRAAGSSITAELGGEFIDSGHTHLRALVQELGLLLVDLQDADPGLIPETWYFEGRRIQDAEIVQWFVPLAQKIQQDLATLKGDGSVSYQEANGGDRLDQLSIADYLAQAPIHPTLQNMLRVAYTTEYGREPEEQSSLNLLFLIGTETNQFALYGSSDERYQVEGGNQQISDRLAQSLTAFIETGTSLESLRQLPDQRYRATLQTGWRTIDRTYERVLLTVPFSVLRHIPLLVNLPPAKRIAIQELGYGTNAKLITRYRERLWRNRYNSTAATFTDLPLQSTWETGRYESGPEGLMTNFVGGHQGLELRRGTAEAQAKARIPQLEKIFPGLQSLRQGNAIRAYWPGEPYIRGSYACYLVGQWTRFSGAEAEPVGNLFFAGEHCSSDAQGYMEGGCETGEAAALDILRAMGLKAPAAQQENRILANRLARRQIIQTQRQDLERAVALVNQV